MNGTIYRLDYGTNDNGSAINWVYDTPSLILDNNFFEKQQFAYLLDVDRASGLNITLGASVDDSDFSSGTYSLTGTGRLLRTIYGVLGPKRGKSFRFRFSNNQLDKPFTLHGFSLIYLPTETLP